MVWLEVAAVELEEVGFSMAEDEPGCPEVETADLVCL